ncbi:MAG: hypothetical protein A3F74_22605 [Betaproteobacteria bacterium RIFCSPLOWO2_12_FULL_62_58]|nr:MAG: hypothetical protein A3F74_22605 [Betaproteobacteria bacterium RIFCSPLOWO2_12_FULL_62_58]
MTVAQGTVDIARLGRALHASPQQARHMIEELERLGYLDEVVAGCGQPCERCPLQQSCLFRNRPRLWKLTRKGERFLTGRGTECWKT